MESRTPKLARTYAITSPTVAETSSSEARAHQHFSPPTRFYSSLQNRKRSRTLPAGPAVPVAASEIPSPWSAKRVKLRHHPPSPEPATASAESGIQPTPPQPKRPLYAIEFARITEEEIDAILKRKRENRAFTRFLESSARKRALDNDSAEEDDGRELSRKKEKWEERDNVGAATWARKDSGVAKRREKGTRDRDSEGEEAARRPRKRARADAEGNVDFDEASRRGEDINLTMRSPSDTESPVKRRLDDTKRLAAELEDHGRAIKRARTDMLRKRAQSFYV